MPSGAVSLILRRGSSVPTECGRQGRGLTRRWRRLTVAGPCRGFAGFTRDVVYSVSDHNRGVGTYLSSDICFELSAASNCLMDLAVWLWSRQ